MANTATEKQRHGSTNSRANSTSAVSAVGVDTVSVAYRSHDPKLWERVSEIAEAGEVVVKPPSWSKRRDPDPGEVVKVSEVAFGSLALDRAIRCAQWRIYPVHRLIYFEGRLGAVAADCATDHKLASPAHLPKAAGEASQAFERVTGLAKGALQDAEQSVRRLDLAAELRFECRSDGLAFLRALSCLSVPRRKTQVWKRGGRVETVSFHYLAGGLLLRVYDKGVELKARGCADAEPPGHRIRLERQHRWQRKKQKAPEQIATADHGAMWLDGFESWCAQAERVSMAAPEEQAEAIIGEVEAGVLTVAEAERLLAASAIARHRGTAWWAENHKPDTGRRRAAEAAAAGVALGEADATGGAVSVELAPSIRALRDAWR